MLGALAICAAGYVFTRQSDAEEDLGAVRRFLAVRTRSVSTGPNLSDSPPAVAVQISPKLLRVTAIALGHPRLAVINGQELTEGDSLTVQAPDAAVAVTLRVLKIRDGLIELANGSQIVTVRLPR